MTHRTLPSSTPPGRSPRRSFPIHVLLLGAILCGNVAHATTYTWNVASGDWFTPGNWSPSGPPGASDDAVISNGGTCTLNAAASVTNFTLSSGTLAGSGTLDVSGAMSWSGGRLTVGVTNANGGLSLSGALDKELFGGTLNVNSVATWTGTGNIVYSSSNPLLSIAAPGTFDIQTDADFSGNGGAAFMTINNAGTFQKSAGAGTTEVGFALSFNNSGAVDVQTGTLVLRGSGTSSGSFDSTGATLTFNPSVGSETITLTSAASMTGGTVTFSGVSGTTVNHAGSYAVGTTNVTSGAVNLTGPGATLGTTVLSGAGTLNVSTSTASTASSLTLGGIRGGSGTLDVSGAMTWNSGRLSGGITNANGGLSLSGALDKELFGGTLNVNSVATWTGTGNIVYSSSNPLLSIAAPGTFDIQTDADFSGNGGAAFMTISNAGTFQKSAGAGSTDVGFALAFNNTGTMQALSGTLALPGSFGSYTQTAGVTRLNGGAVTKSGGTMSIQGGTLEGVGTLTADVNNSGGTLSPGLSPGQLNETGAYTQGASGAFTTEIGGLTVGTDYDRAAITGAATLAGTLNISLINGFEPNIGDTFTIMTFGSRSGDFATVNGTTIPNGKAFQKTVNATSVVLAVVAVTTTTTTTTTTSTTLTTTSTTTTTSSTTTSTTETTSTTVTTSSTTTTTFPGLGHLKCYKGKDSRAKATYTLGIVPNSFSFPQLLGCQLRVGARAICVEVDKQNVAPPPPGGGPTIPPNAGAVFLSYKMKCPKQPTASTITLADQFGSGSFTTGTGSFSLNSAKELLVPALPGPDNDHFACFKAKDGRPKASYTMDLIAGVGGFVNETGCSVRLGAKLVCVQVTKQGVTPAPPGGGPGPGPDSGAIFLSYKLKCPLGAVPPAAFTDQFGSGTFTPGTAKTFLVPAE